MGEKKYIVIKDFQGGEFGMYRVYTAKEWGEQAYEWADSDGSEEADQWLLENFTKGYWVDGDKNRHQFTEQDLINEIADMWQIELVELNKNDKKVIDFLEDTHDIYQDSREGQWAFKLLEELGVI